MQKVSLLEGDHGERNSAHVHGKRWAEGGRLASREI
jgi:hypothetical protein